MALNQGCAGQSHRVGPTPVQNCHAVAHPRSVSTTCLPITPVAPMARTCNSLQSEQPRWILFRHLIDFRLGQPSGSQSGDEGRETVGRKRISLLAEI